LRTQLGRGQNKQGKISTEANILKKDGALLPLG